MSITTKKYIQFNNKPKRCFKRIKSNTSVIEGATTYQELVCELDYSYDSLATISVIFDSLRLTYTSNQENIERLRNNTRLNDMEKELLTAYDDLSLQINHLKKDITKIEQKIWKLKDEDCILSSSSSESWD